ncbi:hypothetical protein LTR36_008863 [Oleoguttula mirabilis]|uniref:Uncharacterized protein n=1 Tax=Oleoguttula mirabilis TaxID=1507867 RepID=A0AAV9J7K7_9PEZI|nr:hypothetical protein LTR36_008863 [Oleoguttula mirabilis]
MADLEAVEDAELGDITDIAAADVGEDQDDRSSSLSEPEDEQDEEEPQNGLIAAPEESLELTAEKSLDVDSEAETERLEQTPQKLRKHADSVGRTPSKLSQAATVEDELSEPPSPLPLDVGAASSTSTIGTAGKKRKRSGSTESSLTSAASDLDESPRKRSHESPVEPESREDEHEKGINGRAEITVEEVVEHTILLEELVDTPVAAAVKTLKGKKGKQKGRKLKDVVTEIEPEHLEAVEAEQEPSEELAAKTAEQRQQKAQAATLFEEVAKQFTAFRDRLYTERLAAMTSELHLLSQPDCQHLDYLRQVACVDARRDKQIREANAYYHYRLTATRQRTLGDRSQLHSQYYQHVRELREDVLDHLGEEWYNIQKERRQQYQEKDEAYVFKFPTKKSAQIRQQAKYNQEVSVLSGVAKYVGFPAAPEIGGAEGDSLEDDFKTMRIPKRVPQPTVHRQVSQQVLYPSVPVVSAQSERLAHDQFIEQNAWAQPQRPIHAHGAPNLTHTPDWAEPGPQHNPARNLMRNLSGQLHRANSPFATPMPQKRTQPDHSSSGTVAVNSDGAEPPSSVLAAPPTSDRMHQLHQHASSNQVSPLVVNKYRQNGTELTGFRNISNVSGVSGASTIDAPLGSAEKDRERERESQHQYQHQHQYQQPLSKSLPALLSEISAPQQAFNPSQLHRHGEERREAYPSNAGFRPQEGVFGTPAPLQARASVPP